MGLLIYLASCVLVSLGFIRYFHVGQFTHEPGLRYRMFVASCFAVAVVIAPLILFSFIAMTVLDLKLPSRDSGLTRATYTARHALST